MACLLLNTFITSTVLFIVIILLKPLYTDCGFFFDLQARAMTSMTPEQRKQALAAHYAEKFQCPELRYPANYAEKNWAEEQYAGGCYVSNFPPGVLTEFGEEIRRPFGRVYFAGTESATFWMGYMEVRERVCSQRVAKQFFSILKTLVQYSTHFDENVLIRFLPMIWVLCPLLAFVNIRGN